MDKTLPHYKRLPYTLRTEPQKDSDGTRYWTAEYVELRGCKTDGTTVAEAIANLQQLFDEYISARIENQLEITEPVIVKADLLEEITIYRKRAHIWKTISLGAVEQTKIYRNQAPKEGVPHDAQKTEETKGESESIYSEVEAA